MCRFVMAICYFCCCGCKYVVSIANSQIGTTPWDFLFIWDDSSS
jgi:hypothetical protein